MGKRNGQGCRMTFLPLFRWIIAEDDISSFGGGCRAVVNKPWQKCRRALAPSPEISDCQISSSDLVFQLPNVFCNTQGFASPNLFLYLDFEVSGMSIPIKGGWIYSIVSLARDEYISLGRPLFLRKKSQRTVLQAEEQSLFIKLKNDDKVKNMPE
ncbi:MAG: hypothetical protein Q7R53_02625 [bacterium]|nr:hypothetical protein [bacterium]